MSVDELAKAMTDHHPIPGVCLPRGAVEVTCREHARAAYEFFHITPEQAERMEKGAVGEAMSRLESFCRVGCIGFQQECIDKQVCGVAGALLDLGVEVSHG